MTLGPDTSFSAGPNIGTFLHKMRAQWGWFVVLGALAAVSGMLALILTATATIVSVVVIGMLMIVIGAVEIALGFRARNWGRRFSWELAGALYVMAGTLAVMDPVPASSVITLFIGAGLLATGAVRLVTGVRLHDAPARGPLLLAGGVTTLLGLVIVAGWPGNSLLVLGTLLGIDLVLTGVGQIVFGLRLRAA